MKLFIATLPASLRKKVIFTPKNILFQYEAFGSRCFVKLLFLLLDSPPALPEKLLAEVIESFGKKKENK